MSLLQRSILVSQHLKLSLEIGGFLLGLLNLRRMVVLKLLLGVLRLSKLALGLRNVGTILLELRRVLSIRASLELVVTLESFKLLL